MYRVLYWNEKKELLSFNTLAGSFKETIQLFIEETNQTEQDIYSINVIH